jgi:hypothetical protein
MAVELGSYIVSSGPYHSFKVIKLLWGSNVTDLVLSLTDRMSGSIAFSKSPRREMALVHF